MSEPLVPLSHIALELGTTADKLEQQHAAAVLVDDLGRLALDRDQARELITRHRAELAARSERRRRRDEANRARMAELDKAHPRHRVQQLQAAQMAAAINVDGLTLAEAAYAVASADAHKTRLDSASRRYDSYIAAQRDDTIGYGATFGGLAQRED